MLRNAFELPRQVEAIQMSNNNICFYKIEKLWEKRH